MVATSDGDREARAQRPGLAHSWMRRIESPSEEPCPSRRGMNDGNDSGRQTL